MTFPEIAKWRLISQQLTGTTIKPAVEMVEWMGAVQGQEYAQTKWGLGLRLPHLNDSDIERDLTDGNILRTHLLRPTWHFVSARDIRWLLALTAPRVNAANAYMYRQLELDDRIFNRCIDSIVKTLQGGRQLTRDAINEEFKRNNIFANGHRLSYIMMYAELAGIICSGARQGNQFTYALLEERVGNTGKSADRDGALAELATRYFKSRGPATVNDFATWSGLTVSDCKKGTELIKRLLNKEVIAGREYFFTENGSLTDHEVKKVYLLPVYDEFIMGYKDRTPAMIMKNTLEKNPGYRYDCMIVYDGQVIGTWKRTMSKTAIDMNVQFFSPPGKQELRAFESAVQRFGEYTGMNVSYEMKA